MKAKNILSIDWDFYADANEWQRGMLFPDGGNESLSSYLSDFIWSSRYVGNTELQGIKVKKDALMETKRLFRNINAGARVLAVESHLHLYHFIKSFNEPVNVYNIDFHHDVFDNGGKDSNGNLELNCGNWLRLAFDEGLINSATWIRQDDSIDRKSVV